MLHCMRSLTFTDCQQAQEPPQPVNTTANPQQVSQVPQVPEVAPVAPLSLALNQPVTLTYAQLEQTAGVAKY